jgi:stearoyl-CoA desaturase (delta-9 desaturase)
MAWGYKFMSAVASTGFRKFTQEWDIVGIGWFVACHLIALLGFFTFSWENLLVCLGIYAVTQCLGITLGFHRLLSHRSFKAPKWVERTLAFIGTLTLQRSPLEWVAHHRIHHAHSDSDKDPHNSILGFWHSHILWIVKNDAERDDMKHLSKFARDISSDPFMRFLESKWVHTFCQVAFGLILLAIGGWDWVIWGIFVRLVFGYHATFFVNSVCHAFGYRTYATPESSKNCWWAALLTFGEGWHNNHHAFQHLARAGHRWWEVDMTYGVIRVMQLLGLAWDVKDIPSTERKTARISSMTPAPVVVRSK